MTDFDAESSSEAELLPDSTACSRTVSAARTSLQELAPAGWEASPLAAVFHPSPARLFEEAINMHRNLCALRRPDDDRPLPPEPTLDEVAREHVERAFDSTTEGRELVSLCLWDVFSDSHELFEYLEGKGQRRDRSRPEIAT